MNASAETYVLSISHIEDAIAQLRHAIVLGLVTFPFVAMPLKAASPAAAPTMPASAAVATLLVAIGPIGSPAVPHGCLRAHCGSSMHAQHR